jgi:hypothetical protein
MRTLNKYVCLLQGRASEINNFKFLQTEYSKVISLSWDFELTENTVSDHHYFLPNSTWAEGRNFLLQKALEHFPEFNYVIFLDGDLKITKGNFVDFLEFLDIYKPDLGIPLSSQIKESFRFIPSCSVQTQVSFDQIMQAYSSKTVTDKICLPFDTQFDSLSWWYSCEINQYLTVKYYGEKVLQFNELVIDNTHHSDPGDLKVNKSHYIGGRTKNGIAKCKKHIERKFGQQGILIGTLFHLRLLPKPSEENILAFLKNREEAGISLRMGVKICLRIIEFPYKVLLKVLFRRKYPSPKRIPLGISHGVKGGL